MKHLKHIFELRSAKKHSRKKYFTELEKGDIIYLYNLDCDNLVKKKIIFFNHNVNFAELELISTSEKYSKCEFENERMINRKFAEPLYSTDAEMYAKNMDDTLTVTATDINLINDLIANKISISSLNIFK